MRVWRGAGKINVFCPFLGTFFLMNCIDYLLILEEMGNFMNRRFYVTMGISVIALAVGFIILFG